MGSKWKKIKALLGLRICLSVPPHLIDPDDSPAPSTPTPDHLVSSSASESLATRSAPTTPHRSAPPTVNVGRHSLRLSRSTCSICLETMKPGHGYALFTAECSHTFHFSCIASNVRHGNLVCPVCRAKWREVPWQASVEGSKCERGRSGSHTRRVPRSLTQVGRAEMSHASDEERRRLDPLYILDENISRRQWQQNESLEPNLYNDDEPILQVNRGPSTSHENHTEDGPSNTTGFSGTGEAKMEALGSTGTGSITGRKLDVKMLSEVSAVPAMESRDSFTVLVHLKAPPARAIGNRNREMEGDVNSFHLLECSCRAPLDLVTVLDVSGSMAGTKLALLKRAMGFVIRNLSPADRLSVVVFSSTARRIFPLRRMQEEGKQQSLRAIDALISTGGTNIAEGLRKGARVLEDRRERNPVCSIMLLSDGQDTYTMSSRRQVPFFVTTGASDCRRLVPGSIRHSARHGRMQIPVHTFGFGADHDAATMHTISEVSGGTFSFIQTEGVVQDAFAQCIGGLLSVVVQDVQLMVSCSAPGVLINSIHAGSYNSSILDNSRHGIVKLGDLYAEEERDVLVEVKLPSLSQYQFGRSMCLLQGGCMYKEPVTQEMHQIVAEELCITRPESIKEGDQELSLEVDRQRNRLRTAEAIAAARSLADQGDLDAAQCNLQNAKIALENSPSSLAGDQLCNVLEAELNEIQMRMANRQLYETSGRAYLLSAQSSHLRQRATTRGESLDTHSHDYQTPSMVDMILQSQTLSSAELSTPGAFPSSAARPNRGKNATVSSSPTNHLLSRRPSGKAVSSKGSASAWLKF